METADAGTDTSDLAGMNDPDLIRHWADVRTRLALARKDSPHYPGLKSAYDAALDEYRRRVAVKTP